MDSAIDLIKQEYDKYINEFSDLEVEFRLGYIQGNKFNTDIGKDYFNTIKEQLDFSNVFETDIIKTTDYFFKDRRMSINEENNSVCIKKIKLKTLDFEFKGTGFDIRVAFSREIKSNRFPIEKAEYTRKKDRTSYNYNYVKYDLTEVKNTINNVLYTNYEVEIELNKFDPIKMSSRYVIHGALLKIKDLAQMCEEIDDNYSIDLKT